MSENDKVLAILGKTDIQVDEEELELKKLFLESLKVQVEIDTEINRYELRKILSEKEKIVLNGITKEKVDKESSKSLSEAFMAFIKAGQLLEGKPTEINKHEFENLTDEEIDREEARIVQLLSAYSSSEINNQIEEESFVKEIEWQVIELESE